MVVNAARALFLTNNTLKKTFAAPLIKKDRSQPLVTL